MSEKKAFTAVDAVDLTEKRIDESVEGMIERFGFESETAAWLRKSGAAAKKKLKQMRADAAKDDAAHEAFVKKAKADLEKLRLELDEMDGFGKGKQ